MNGETVASGVLVLHPSPMLREALAYALQDGDVPDIRQADDLPSALAELSRQPSAVTLAGVEAAPNGVAAFVAALLDGGSEAVVVLAPEVRETDLLAALEAGTLGYVGRDEPLDRLVFDIKGALRGEACLPRDQLAPVLRLLIERKRAEDARAARLARLSRREREVLEHLANGAGNDEIAAVLFLSPATVRTHVQNILTKLEVHSRLEAIALAHEVTL